ncbi:MAG: 16S rRNA (guanine(527)-N(7))-methyltransferase RsmG, partial [Firmicutes bacterium]|nr:16S rRNA (guanine(527)-N(7))-methyltransferase RsmG [Bacillota bacterium]
MWDELKRLTTTMGIVLPDNAPTLFAQYYSFLVEQNKYVNLTRITETREVMIKHFLDSLALLVKLPLVREKVLDIGSGAGLPGIPLKVACPGLSLTLLDSSQKRVDFLQAVTSHLALGMVQAHHGRAEDYGKQSNFRDKYEVVVSRAVAQLAVLTELCLPFVAVGGFFVAYKGPDALEGMLIGADAFTTAEGVKI